MAYALRGQILWVRLMICAVSGGWTPQTKWPYQESGESELSAYEDGYDRDMDAAAGDGDGLLRGGRRRSSNSSSNGSKAYLSREVKRRRDVLNAFLPALLARRCVPPVR